MQAIAVKLLSEDLGGYEGVDNLVDNLIATTSTETVEKILYIVAPHWVDAGAAGRSLPSVACLPFAIAMNGQVFPILPRNVIFAGPPLSRLQRVLPIPGGNSGDIVQSCNSRALLACAP